MDVPLSDSDLTSALRHEQGFAGVHAYDLLPRLEDGQFCIVNTDNVLPNGLDPPEGGHHWLTVCREGDRVLIFDSFARTLGQMERDYTEPGLEHAFHVTYPDCELLVNTQVLQDTSTAVCGRYAILVGKLFAMHGIDRTLSILHQTFTDDTLDNDRRLIGGAAAWTDDLAREMHRQRRVHFPRRRVIVHELDDIWSADLVDMQSFSKHNKRFKYLLTVIDLFSRYAWVEPLKDKTGTAVKDAFKRIVRNSGRRPKRLWVDEGREFYNHTLQRWLKENGIDLYSTHNEGKAVVVERFNRTLKTRMWKHFTASSTNVYVNVLPSLVADYNNTRHRSIGMTPSEASRRENAPYLEHSKGLRASSARFRVGDQVRITVSKRHFEKGYTPNWTEEVFVIDRVLPTTPVTYQIRDLLNEPVVGSFYEQQLQKTMQTQFRIEKVLRKRRGQSLVKWKGYPEKFNSWLDKDQLQALH